MKQREKRNIVIGILCCMVVFMSVGYAILSQNLKITGTANVTGSWKIYIESIKLNESASSIKKEDSTTQISEGGLSAVYTASFQKPRDVAVYDVVVANAGTIDAVLESLELSPELNEFFTFETIGIGVGDRLNAQTGDTPTRINFQIKVTFKDSVTEANMPSVNTKVNGSVVLNYGQVTNSSGSNDPSLDGSGEEIILGDNVTFESNMTLNAVTLNPIPTKIDISKYVDPKGGYTFENIELHNSNGVTLKVNAIPLDDDNNYGIMVTNYLDASSYQFYGGYVYLFEAINTDLEGTVINVSSKGWYPLNLNEETEEIELASNTPLSTFPTFSGYSTSEISDLDIINEVFGSVFNYEV